VGPIIGGIMYDCFNYNHTMDVNMVIELLLAFAFMYWNCGRHVYQNNLDLKSTVAQLKEIGI